MENYYGRYLANSELYQNLKKAMEEIKVQIEKLEDLEKSFADSSGNQIDIIKDDIKGLINGLTSYRSSIRDYWNQLDRNAKSFDNVLEEWQTKAQGGSTDFEAPVSHRYEKESNTFVDFLYQKISNVQVGTDGYIHVEVTCYIDRKAFETATHKTVDNLGGRIDKGKKNYIVYFDGTMAEI